MGTQDTQQLFSQPTRELRRVSAVRQTRRLMVLVLGAALIAAGVVLTILPVFPGFPLIFLGLSVLSWEFPWAKRLLFRARLKVKQIRVSRKLQA